VLVEQAGEKQHGGVLERSDISLQGFYNGGSVWRERLKTMKNRGDKAYNRKQLTDNILTLQFKILI
jgi:hypothetical protein